MAVEAVAHGTKGGFRRIEDDALLRGRARFVDDIKIPGLLHVAFVRSPHGHAKVGAIDAEEARGLPGVHAILAYDDLRPVLTSDSMAALKMPSGYVRFDAHPFVLAKDEVTYVGEAVAMVVAESRRVAEDAAALVNVDFDPLPSVTDVVAAIEPGSPKVRSDYPDNLVAKTRVLYGDPAGAFARAAYVFGEHFRVHKGGGHPMEGRGLVASFDPATDVLTLWDNTQLPYRAKSVLTEMLDRTENQIRLITPDSGGGFGTKAVFYPEELAVAAASIVLQRPVKWIEDRFENFVAAAPERDQVYDVEVAVDAEGRLLGIRGKLHHDHGATTPYGFPIPYNSVTNMIGNYMLPAMEFDIFWCMTNMPPTSSTRGAGRPQGTFIMERMLDLVARRLDIDRLEIRRRNLIPAEKMPFSYPVTMRDGKPMTYDSGDYPESQRRAALEAGWDGFAARREESEKRGKLRGIGLANYVELTGRGPFESVTVRVGPSGKIMVSTGATAQGQGIKTALAEIIGGVLKVDPAAISVTCGDTSESVLGIGAFASRQTVTAGNSASEAAQIVAKKALEIASVLMEAEVDDLELCDAGVSVRGVPGTRRGLGELAKAVNGSIGFPMPGGLAAGLSATSNFQVTGTPFSSGTHVCEVEVDPDTGGVEILAYTVIHDCGRVINPTVVDGQVVGGVVHGIGAALFEHMQYDENGQPQTVTYADYLLPSADVVPRIKVGHIESPSPLNPLGVKGAGEGGTVGALGAVAAAVDDAVSRYGIFIRQLPITPARLCAEIQAAKRASS